MNQSIAMLFRLWAHALPSPLKLRRDESPRHYATPPSGGGRFVFSLYPRVSFALLTPHRGYFMPPRHTARLSNSARFARPTDFNLSRSEGLFMPTRKLKSLPRCAFSECWTSALLFLPADLKQPRAVLQRDHPRKKRPLLHSSGPEKNLNADPYLPFTSSTFTGSVGCCRSVVMS